MLFPIFENTFLLLFFFLITSAGILYISFLFTESIKSVLSRFKLAENFVGSSLLAAGTSLAEAINAITAGFYDRFSGKSGIEGIKYSLDSFYNLTGAISIQLVFLSFVSLIKKKRLSPTFRARREYQEFTSSIFYQKTTLWAISTSEIAILTVSFIFTSIFSKISIGSYSLLPFIFLIFWILYLFFTKKTNEAQDPMQITNYTNIFQKFNNKQFLSLFILIFLAFTFLAFLNFNLVANFERIFSVPKNVGLGIILSLITSFPEFASFSFLFRSKCYQTACAGFLGSALFNLVLPVITQIIKRGWLLEPLSLNGNEKISLVIWLSSVLLINLLFFAGFYKVEKFAQLGKIKKINRSKLCGILVIFTYTLASCIIPIFSQNISAKATH